MAKKYRLKVDYITIGGECVFKAGTEFTETAPGSGTYQSRNKFTFYEKAVNNTDFFEEIKEEPNLRVYAPEYFKQCISVSLSSETCDGLPRYLNVNGKEYLHPELMKHRIENAFYMSRDKILLPPDYIGKQYRFAVFEDYYEYHKNEIRKIEK